MNKRRTYLVYSKITEMRFGEEKDKLHSIGVAFKNDAQSFDVILNSLPVAERKSGLTKLYIRPPKNNNSIPQNSYTLFDMPLEAE